MSHLLTTRHDVWSVFQSAVDDVIARQEAARNVTRAVGERPDMTHPTVRAAAHVAREKATGQPPAGDAPDQASGDLNCVRLAADYFEARLKGDAARADRLREMLDYSTCDPRWAEVIEEYLSYFGPDGRKQAIPYVRYRRLDDFVLETLPADAKVAVVGDWGTGTATAVDVLQQILRHAPDVLLHLGDIYYSGTERETQQHFLDVVDHGLERAHTRIPVYTLTGNHDMYSGGQGYYDLLPRLNPAPPFEPAQAQPASYFSLRTRGGAWQLLCLDTGLHDHDPFGVSTDVTYLEPQEVDWHTDKIRRFSAQGGRTILFSHHQLFSAFESIGAADARPAAERWLNPKLHEAYRTFAAAGEVAAWFWGHEHNLCVYDAYAGLARGRCVGHGAIPVFVEPDPYRLFDDGPDAPRLVDDPARPGLPLRLAAGAEMYSHGYLILQLDDANRRATVEYYQMSAPDAPMFTEQF